MPTVNRFDLLVAVYIFCIAVAELMGAKTFPLFKIGDFMLNASVAIFVVPVIFSINDVIVEVFGKERARSVVRSGLLVILLLIFTALFFTWLPPTTRFAGTEAAYDTIFQTAIRISVASLIAFAVSQFLDIAIFAKIRERMRGNALWLRNNVSNIMSQFVDTAVFMTLAFWALDKGFADNVAFLASISIPYWLLKCFMSVIETPFVYLGVRWLKKEQNLS